MQPILALDPRVVVPGVQKREEPIQGRATAWMELGLQPCAPGPVRFHAFSRVISRFISHWVLVVRKGELDKLKTLISNSN